MKRTLIILSIVCSLLLALVLWRGYQDSGFRFIQRTTGVSLPKGSVELAMYDSGDFYVVGVQRIPLTAIVAFADQYNFVRSPTHPNSYWFGNLPAPYKTLPESPEIFVMSGKSALNSWSFALDRFTGTLWVVVYYPDAGGSPPAGHK